LIQSAAPEASVQEMLLSIEKELKESVGALKSDSHPALSEMVEYHFGWHDPGSQSGGKRVRPLLTLLCCAAAGGNWQEALPAAAAVELIHNFSLVHDDIEDRSASRRGRETLWHRWGIAQAINTGDAMFVLAFRTCDRLLANGLPAQRVLEVLTHLSGACLQLTIGQHSDLRFEAEDRVTEEEYQAMIDGKTSSLLAAACAIGALVAGVPESLVQAYDAFGRHLGLGFQMLDDILGIWGRPEETGKPVRDDLRLRKKSLPVLVGLRTSPEFAAWWARGSRGEQELEEMAAILESCGALTHSREAVRSHTDLALAHLMEAMPLQPAADELRNLAQRLVSRKS